MTLVAPGVYLYEYKCSNPDTCQPYRQNIRPGKYKIEAWGAQGGNVTYNSAFSEGGRGGYVEGILENTKESILYIFPGEGGIPAASGGCSRSTYGGGGAGCTNNYWVSASGGGMSFVSLDQPQKESGIIFAAGGAGSAVDDKTSNPGGYGGGEKGGDGRKSPSRGSLGGTAGSQNSGGTNPSDSSRNGGKFYGGSAVWAFYGSGGGGGYYGGAAGHDYAATGGGGSSFFSPSLFNASIIPGNNLMPSRFSLNERTTGNPGHGAVRITMLGYTLQLRDNLDSHYETNSTISVHIRLISLGAGEFATVRRTFNGTTREIMTKFEDKGTDIIHNDIFYLDCKGGHYTIKYETSTKDNLTQEFSFDILVTKTPEIKVFTEPKKYYIPEDIALIDIGLIDDEYADVFIKEGSITYYSKKLQSNDTMIREKLWFDIPNYTIGSTHTIEVFATDNYGINSSIRSFDFTMVKNRSPDVMTNDNLPYYYDVSKIIFLNAAVRDTDPDKNVCIMTLLDNRTASKQHCLDLTDSDFHGFQVNQSLKGLSNGIHYYTVFAMDSYQYESNRIVHTFALFSSSFFQYKTLHDNPYVCRNYKLLYYIIPTYL